MASRRVSKVGLLRRLAVREKASDEAAQSTALLLTVVGALRFASAEHAGGQLPNEIIAV
jgi:hypothetical protein